MLFALVVAGSFAASGCGEGPEYTPEQLYDILEICVPRWDSAMAAQDVSRIAAEIERNSRAAALRPETIRSDARRGGVREKILASFALGFSSDPEAMALLRENFHDPSPRVRGNAIASSGLLVYRKAVPPDKAPLQEYLALLGPDSPPESVHAALFALSLFVSAKEDYGFTSLAVEQFRNSKEEIRAEAVKVVRLTRKPTALGPLRELLRDPSELVRMQAILAVSVIAKESAIGDLLAMYSDPSPDVVRMAVQRIGEIAPRGVEFACPEHPGTEARSGEGRCPSCGRSLQPRPRR